MPHDSEPKRLTKRKLSLLLPDEYQRFLIPLGELVIIWNFLEDEINSLLASVTDNYNTNTSDLVFTELDFRSKIAAIKNCAFLESHNDKWFDALETELNNIDNTHRPARNRMIHDHLTVENGIVFRVTIETKLYRPQSHQRRLLWRRRRSLTALAIRKVTGAVLKSTKTLKHLREEFEGARPRTKREIPLIGHPKPVE